MPFPDKESTEGELAALLAKEAVAETVPPACGAKVTLNAALWPAEIVSGNEMPLTENSELLKVTEVTVTLAMLALMEAVVLALLPTVTLPKL